MLLPPHGWCSQYPCQITHVRSWSTSLLSPSSGVIHMNRTQDLRYWIPVKTGYVSLMKPFGTGEKQRWNNIAVSKVQCKMLNHEKFPCNEYPSMPLLGAIPGCWLLKIQQNGFTVLVNSMKEEKDKKAKNNDTDGQACDPMKRRLQLLAYL